MEPTTRGSTYRAHSLTALSPTAGVFHGFTPSIQSSKSAFAPGPAASGGPAVRTQVTGPISTVPGKALLTRRPWSFHRTPKYALQRDGDAWENKRYQVPLDLVSLAELAVIGLGLFAMGRAVGHADYGVLPVLAPYTAAFAFVFVLTIKQSRREKGGKAARRDA